MVADLGNGFGGIIPISSSPFIQTSIGVNNRQWGNSYLNPFGGCRPRKWFSKYSPNFIFFLHRQRFCLHPIIFFRSFIQTSIGVYNRRWGSSPINPFGGFDPESGSIIKSKNRNQEIVIRQRLLPVSPEFWVTSFWISSGEFIGFARA